jgi:hypothetical protein
LIKLQGSAESVANVGRLELLRVQKLAGKSVNFVSPALGHYGATEGRDDALDAAVVLLQRVPNYSRLEVPDGARLTAAAWDGEKGGVLALRVLGDIVLDGSIDMSGRGFRGGAERPEVLEHGLSGESIDGLGSEDVAPNRGGGGGGLGDQTTTGCVQDGNAGGGGAHLAPGGDAVVGDLCDGAGRGRGGLAYAATGRLFLGSGGGSGGVDNVRVDNPPGAPGGAGGGLIWLLGQSIRGSGSIRADGADGTGDPAGLECQGPSTTSCYDHSGPGGAGAGGSIRLGVPVLQGVSLSAAGGVGGNGVDSATGNGGDGSNGVVEP